MPSARNISSRFTAKPRQLYRHAAAGKSWGHSKDRIILAESGDVIELDEFGGRINEKIHVGRVLIDDSRSGLLTTWLFTVSIWPMMA
ncbi:MAG: hypothetical protein U0Y68_10260 [Blastocatellia bacterium]